MLLEVNPGAIVDTIAVGSTTPVVTSVQVLNLGNGSLAWRVRTVRAVPWLSMQPDSGTGGDRFSVRINPSGLSVGDYADTVIVAENSTAQVDLVAVLLRMQ